MARRPARFLLWLPRTPRENESELWQEYAAWRRAAMEPATSGVPREKRARQRCLERAEDLRAAVTASVQRLYREGRWMNARGAEGSPPGAPTCAECLAGILAPGFQRPVPAVSRALGARDIPSRAATPAITGAFHPARRSHLTPQALLGEYIERLPFRWGAPPLMVRARA